MAVAVCDDCGGKVSVKAPACPHCGAPRGNAQASNVPGVRTVERTLKSLKARLLVANLIIVAGVLMMIFGFGGGGSASPLGLWGVGVGVCGFIYQSVVRSRIWWNHE